MLSRWGEPDRITVMMKKVLFQLKGMQVMVVTTDDSDMDWQPVINDGAVHPVAL